MNIHDLTEAYLKAIANPLPELKETFDLETQYINKLIYGFKSRVILDVGCGAGRPLIDLYTLTPFRLYIGVDNNYKLLNIAREKTNGLNGIIFDKGDAFDLPYSRNTFDFVYSTYNTLGSILKEDRLKFVSEQFRVLRKKGHLLLSTWKRDDSTTEFLKKYYPSIGITIFGIEKDYISTDKALIHRVDLIRDKNSYIPSQETRDYSIKSIETKELGLWNFILFQKI